MTQINYKIKIFCRRVYNRHLIMASEDVLSVFTPLASLASIPDGTNAGEILQWTGSAWLSGYIGSHSGVVLPINDTSSLPAAPAAATYGQLYKVASSDALYWRTQGSGAVYLGGIAAGTNNGAAGVGALAAVTSGVRNAAFGPVALNLATSGSDNTALGYNAGAAVTTGSNNTLLGSGAGSSLTTGANNIVIGKGATTTAATTSNQLVIGDATLETAIVSSTADVASAHRVAVKIGSTVYYLLAV